MGTCGKLYKATNDSNNGLSDFKHMQKELIVNLISPTERGRLFYHPDPQIEPGMFYIDSLIHRKVAHTVNINGGQILLRADEDRTLMMVEFLRQRRNWQKANLLEAPQPVQANDIEFAFVPSERTSFLGSSSEFDADVTLITDENYSAVKIVIGETGADLEKKWIALSEECFVLIIGDELRGFYIKLINGRRNEQKKQS